MNGGIGELGKKGNGTAYDESYSKVSEVNVGGVELGQNVGTTVKEALDLILSTPYAAPTFTSFGLTLPLNIADVELGYRISEGTSLNFNYTISNRQNARDNTLRITTNDSILPPILVNNASLPVLPSSSGIFTYELGSHIQYNSPKDFIATIRATEDRNSQFFQRTFTKAWKNKIYYGVAQDIDVNLIDADWIKTNLTNTILTNQHPFTATSIIKLSGTLGVNEKLYYAYPISFPLVKLKTDLGVEGGSLIIGSPGIEIKTPSQQLYSLDGQFYAVCRTEQSNLGFITRTLSTF
jgi:hypothetical protein